VAEVILWVKDFLMDRGVLDCLQALRPFRPSHTQDSCNPMINPIMATKDFFFGLMKRSFPYLLKDPSLSSTLNFPTSNATDIVRVTLIVAQYIGTIEHHDPGVLCVTLKGRR
jgi:hypothetical protein